MKNLTPGIYDLLRTKDLDKRLELAGLSTLADWSSIDREELIQRLSIIVAREIAPSFQH